MKRLLAVVPLAIALTLGAVSCASAPDSSSPATPTPTATPAPTPTASVEPGTLVEVTNRVFFDYNGNGRQDGEPALPDITLTYQPGNVSCVTDRNGVGTIEVPAGSYHIAVADPASQFHYILTAETTEIDDGLNVDISASGEVSIPLGQGFLTWPFPEGTSYGAIYFFKPDDPTVDPLSLCEEGT